VAGDQQRGTGIDPGRNSLPQQFPRIAIQPRGGFVKQHQLRIAGEGQGHRQQPFLSTRQPAHLLPEQTPDVELLHQFGNAHRLLVERPHVREGLTHPRGLWQAQRLGCHPELGARPRGNRVPAE